MATEINFGDRQSGVVAIVANKRANTLSKGIVAVAPYKKRWLIFFLSCRNAGLVLPALIFFFLKRS